MVTAVTLTGFLQGAVLAVFAVAVVGVVVALLSDDRDPTTVIAWLLVVILLPFVGVVLYFFIGRNYRRETPLRRRVLGEVEAEAAHVLTPIYAAHNGFTAAAKASLAGTSARKLAVMSGRAGGTPILPATSVDLFTAGEEKFASLLAELRAALQKRTIIAGASTHAGEETALIDAHRRLRNSFPGLLTIIAPRHPERGRDILEIARADNLRASLRSRKELPSAETDIYVADTLGELGLIYRLAPIVFVGGSLASHGGQNPIEPIKLGAAILHGPHVWNFADIYAALDEARGAEQVTDVGKLAVRIGAWLTDTHARAAVVAAARATVASLGGGLDRTLAALDPYFMQIRLEHRRHDA